MYVLAGAGVFLPSGIICHVIAKSRKANPVFWGVLGIVFGSLAIPFVFLSKSDRQ